uniref:Uncharacterized protein n=1 Tax=Anguilla anguilla TaxID=7936 RepID=A0A0E9RBH6_ANGAN
MYVGSSVLTTGDQKKALKHYVALSDFRKSLLHSN